MRLAGFFFAACLVLALGQAAATLLTLALGLLCMWAVCFHTKEVLTVLACMLLAYLLAAYPGWCAATVGLVALGRWLKGGEPPTPKSKLLPPPTGD
jgi:hypothetical protein